MYTRKDKPNILFLMCDQLRYDTIASLGNSKISTPNIDRLVKRGVSFSNAYSTCPVCIPARYTIRTGCEPYTTKIFNNLGPISISGEQIKNSIKERCGEYLPQTMKEMGYRTFGVGKFHTYPWNENLGYETQLYSEEIYGSEQQKLEDDYYSFVAENHPEYSFIESLHGERTEMYYIPQMSPVPANITVESWVSDRAVECIKADDGRPYFGFVSFIGPHPPFAPPIPFNRMYNPDDMDNPVLGNKDIDFMDEQIPWMNYIIWAEDISPSLARILKSRYYGEITYIDECIGRILDEVEAGPDSDNTVICFSSDHGDHMGDHHAWQKESFFDVSCKVPFLLSWPKKIQQNIISEKLVCLTDLFGIATTAAGARDIRDGIDVLGMLEGSHDGREYLFGYHAVVGTNQVKIMVRNSKWKYIFMPNGGREQLFNLIEDPFELEQQVDVEKDVADHLRKIAIEQLKMVGLDSCIKENGLLKYDYQPLTRSRIKQFDIVHNKSNDYTFNIRG